MRTTKYDLNLYNARIEHPDVFADTHGSAPNGGKP